MDLQQQWLTMITYMLECIEKVLALMSATSQELEVAEKDLERFDKFRNVLNKIRCQISSLGHNFLKKACYATTGTNGENGKLNMIKVPANHSVIKGCICNTYRRKKNVKKRKIVICSPLRRSALRSLRCSPQRLANFGVNNAELKALASDDNHPNIIKDPRGLKLADNGFGYELFHAMYRHRNKIAQIIEKTDEKQTFEELLSMSICTALKLKDSGLSQNDIACVCLSNGKYTSVPYLAGLFLGCTMSAIDVTFNVKDIAFFLELATPSIIFVDTEKLADIKEALLEIGKSIRIIVVGDSIEGLENMQDYLVSSIEESEKFRPYQVKSMRENCAIFFSSGTSGYPKAICLSHFNLLYQIVYTSVTCNLNDVLLSYTSFYWISGVILLGYCILTGSPRILPMPFDVSRCYKLLDKHRVQIAFLGPHECIGLIKSNKPENIVTSSLKWIVAGGAAMKEDAVSSLKCLFQSCNVILSYGQTETTGPMFRWDITKPEDFELCIAKPASIGRPCGGIWYKVTDENSGSILGPYKAGEICIKSDTLIMNGYYNRDASECFDSNGWLKTGDLGYYDEYHCFYIMDRIKELIKYKGWHVPPLILENLLLKHPVVANAVVIGIPHPEDGEHPTGFIILEHGVDPASVNLQDISEFVNRQVDEKKHLRGRVIIMESFPLTVTGKVNRRILRDSFLRMNVFQETE